MTDAHNRVPNGVAEPRRGRVVRVATISLAIGLAVVLAAVALAVPDSVVILIILLAAVGVVVAISRARAVDVPQTPASERGPPPGRPPAPQRPATPERVPRPEPPAVRPDVALAPATSLEAPRPVPVTPPVAVEAPVKRRDRRAVAVLPFENASADADSEFFGFGIAEEIGNALARQPELRVPGLASVATFGDRQQDVRSIGERLNVGTVLKGSVQQAGDRVQLTTRLIDANDGAQLWTAQYDRDRSDVVAVQDEIVRAVTERVQPGAHAVARLRDRHAADPEAYEHYLKGRHFTAELSEPGFRLAVEAFEAAIALAPDYALAHAALAECQIIRAVVLDEPYGVSAARARAAAREALALNDDIAEAHAVLGAILTYYDLDWGGAEREFRRALELGASSAWVYGWFGDLLAATRRFDEAIDHARRAHEREPLSPLFRWNLVQNLWLAGRLDEAEQDATLALQQFPDLYIVHLFQGLIAWSSGDVDGALAGIERAIDLAGGDPPFAAFRTAACYHFGMRERAEELFAEDRERARRGHVSAAWFALIHLCRRDDDAALASLREGRNNRDAFFAMFQAYVEALHIPISATMAMHLELLGFP